MSRNRWAPGGPDSDTFIGYTIYKAPPSLPCSHVFIPWALGRGPDRWPYVPLGVVVRSAIVCFCGSLQDARECVPLGMANVGRSFSDDPEIVETWI